MRSMSPELEVTICDLKLVALAMVLSLKWLGRARRYLRTRQVEVPTSGLMAGLGKVASTGLLSAVLSEHAWTGLFSSVLSEHHSAPYLRTAE